MWLGNSQLNLGPTPTLWVGTDWGFQNQHVDPAHSAGCSSPLAPDEPRHPPCLLTVHVVLGGSGTRMDSIFHRKENISTKEIQASSFPIQVFDSGFGEGLPPKPARALSAIQTSPGLPISPIKISKATKTGNANDSWAFFTPASSFYQAKTES